MTVSSYPGSHTDRNATFSHGAQTGSARARMIPGSNRFDRSSQRWHAGEPGVYRHTRLISRGAIMPIGGEDAPAPQSPIVQTFFELAGGRNGRILLLPASGERAGGAAYRPWLTRPGATVDILAITSRAEADDPELAARLSPVTGLLIIGGSHEPFQALISDTRLAAAIRASNERGVVVAGCGAGAPLLARHQAPGESASEGSHVRPGIGLLDEVMIDRQTATHGRIEQLLGALPTHPPLVTFCLKPDSALVFTPDRLARVVGTQSVIVVDGRRATAERHDAAAGTVTPTVSGASLHLLAPGSVFDLDRGEVTEVARGRSGRPVG